jgi:hypothetical protein
VHAIARTFDKAEVRHKRLSERVKTLEKTVQRLEQAVLRAGRA